MSAAPEAPPHAIRCPKCALALDPRNVSGLTTSGSSAAPLDCPACRAHFRIQLLPAFTHPPPGISTATGELALDGESVCFFHPAKRAAVACDGCGRFLCALCDVPMGARHLCPSCLGAKKTPELLTQRWLWSQIALISGVAPLLISIFIWPFLVFTGPAAIFVAFWSWNRLDSLVRGQRRWMAVLGALGGLGQLAVIGFFAWVVWRAFSMR